MPVLGTLIRDSKVILHAFRILSIVKAFRSLSTVKVQSAMITRVQTDTCSCTGFADV